MNHHIGDIKNVMPKWDVLNINEINYAAVNKSVKNVTAASADHKPETEILIRLH